MATSTGGSNLQLNPNQQGQDITSSLGMHLIQNILLTNLYHMSIYAGRRGRWADYTSLQSFIITFSYLLDQLLGLLNLIGCLLSLVSKRFNN